MKQHPIISILISAIALTWSCSAFSDGAESISDDTNKNMSGYSKLTSMANTMGGLDEILMLQGVEFIAEGSRFEPEQSYKPDGEFIHFMNYHYMVNNSLISQQSRKEWMNDVLFGFPGQRRFTEIINGQHGANIGTFLIDGPPRAPMLSTRIGARVKQNLVSSPLALIHHASRNPGEVKFLGTEEFNGRRHQIISIPGWDQPIRVFIDVATKLPSKVDTMENDSVYGDTQWEVIFNNWIEVNGIKVPSILTHVLNGRTINNEIRASYTLNETLNSELYEIPSDLIADFNADQFSWGIRSSQWFNRFISLGIPFDLDQRGSATLQIVEIAPKVFHARALTHNSMIIEMDNYLIVSEAPLYDELSTTVINAIQERWPSKPIKYIVLSHFHNDHIGGVRGYGAIGATLIVGKPTKDHFEAVFKAPHTVYPDSYALNPVDVNIISVEAGDDLIITDGVRRVRIFEVANRHAVGTLVPFVEDVNLIFESDLYNPGGFPETIPEPFLSWGVDLLAAIKSSGLDVKTIVGGHAGVSSFEEFEAQIKSSL